MKKFLVKFKDGTELYVDAHKFKNDLNTGNLFRFFKSEKEADNDIYVKTDEVLYVVAVEGSDSDAK